MHNYDWIMIVGAFLAFEAGAWYERQASKRRQKKTLVRVYEAEYICEHRWCSFSVKGREYAVNQVRRQHIDWHIEVQERINRDSGVVKLKKGTDEATGLSTTSSQSGS